MDRCKFDVVIQLDKKKKNTKTAKLMKCTIPI